MTGERRGRAHGPQNPTLSEAVRRIVGTIRPVRIYLFGSRAWGRPARDSDYDLLVIVEDGADERRVAREITVSLWGIPASFDVVVRTRSWWAQWQDAPCSLEEQIATEGLVVHDAV